MNIKTNVVFGIIAVAAAVILFAAGPLAATHQAYACGGWGGGWGGGCCGCFSCCGCCGWGGGWGGGWGW
jgi:hypothetical protein